jgi:hypothetical protein
LSDVVEERAQIVTQQGHTGGGDDGDKGDQKRILGCDRAGFICCEAVFESTLPCAFFSPQKFPERRIAAFECLNK